MHIAIAGNIGCGKTTLTRLLAEHYRFEPLYESLENNPYISDFYADMKRWAFQLQVFFLNSRFSDLLSIKPDMNVIQDRTIFEDARIFAPNLHDMGLMDSRDFENYSSLFERMMSLVKNPDLVIYLRSSVPNLVAQIQKRGREYENTIRLDYLSGLNQRYEDWFEGYDGEKLAISVDDCHFESGQEDMKKVTDILDKYIRK